MIDEETLTERGKLTIIRLEQALERLLNGVPERTPHDGRVNLSRINQEAGLSSGGIYYYDEFVQKAKELFTKESLITQCLLSSQVKLRWTTCAHKGIKNAS